MNTGPSAPALRSHVCCLAHVAVTACKRMPAGSLLTLTVTSAADLLSVSHNLTSPPSLLVFPFTPLSLFRPSPSGPLSHSKDAMCLMCILCSLQAVGVSNGVGAGLVELDENGSVVMGGEQQGPSPLQGSTGASSEDLDSLEALRFISQVSLAVPCVLIQPHTVCSVEQRRQATGATAINIYIKADLHGYHWLWSLLCSVGLHFCACKRWHHW